MGNKIGKRRSSIEDRFTRPQGLYQCKDVDQKKLRRLIRESKLAPCYPGAEEPAADLDECPICFLNYPSLNRSKCCTKGICTECFLQMKSPELLQPPQCPFCKTSNYTVEYRGARSLEEKGVEQAEEQKVIEAKIRMQQKQILEECEQKQEERVVARNSGRFSASLDQESTPLATVPSQTEIEGSLPSRNIWSGAARPVIGYPHTNIFTMPPISADSGLRPHVNGASYARRGNDTFRPNILPASNTLSLQRNYLRASNALGPLVSNTMPLSSGSPYSRYNRSEEFGLDLEEIMVMEAICLSLQDQGMPKQIGNNLATECSANQILHNSHNISTRQTSHDINTYEKEMVPCLNNGIMQDGRCSVTGGLAGTIAAMAERRLAEANSAAVQSNESSHRQCQLPSNRNSCEDNETQVDNSRALVCYGSSPHNAIYDDDDSYEEQNTDTRLQIVGENRSEDLAVSEPVLTWNEPDRNSLAHLIDNLYDLQDINIRSREEQRDTEQDNGPNNNECLLTWIAPENGNLTSFLEGLYKNANLPELDAHSGYDSGGQDNSEGQTNLLTWSEVGMYEMQDNTGSTSRTKDR